MLDCGIHPRSCETHGTSELGEAIASRSSPQQKQTGSRAAFRHVRSATVQDSTWYREPQFAASAVMTNWQRGRHMRSVDWVGSKFGVRMVRNLPPAKEVLMFGGGFQKIGRISANYIRS